MDYSELCYRVRRKMRLSQRAFAVLIGSNQTEISFIERGFVPNNVAKTQRIVELAAQFGIVPNTIKY